jgi:twitching motility two-component system response regulator PilH
MTIETIMVVDDSATDRFLLTEMLETAGYKVIAVACGE